MITIQGIYNGKQILPAQKIPGSGSSKVEITFFEDVKITLEEDMEHFVAGSIFDFWGNERDEGAEDNLSDK